MALIDELTETEEGRRLYQQEELLQEITDLICEVMEIEEISRAELARRLHTTQGQITMLLDGRRNINLRLLSDIFNALGYVLHFRAVEAMHPPADEGRHLCAEGNDEGG